MSDPLPIPRRLTTIAGVAVNLIALNTIQYLAKLAVDRDGRTGSKRDDPDWQGDTSFHANGQALDAMEDSYAVVPPQVRRAVPGIVLGAKVHMRNTRTMDECWGIVGDIGPDDKIGEASCHAAAALGLSPDPRHGGTDDHIIQYTIFAGDPGLLNGLPVKLQPMQRA